MSLILMQRSFASPRPDSPRRGFAQGDIPGTYVAKFWDGKLACIALWPSYGQRGIESACLTGIGAILPASIFGVPRSPHD